LFSKHNSIGSKDIFHEVHMAILKSFPKSTAKFKIIGIRTYTTKKSEAVYVVNCSIFDSSEEYYTVFETLIKDPILFNFNDQDQNNFDN